MFKSISKGKPPKENIFDDWIDPEIQKDVWSSVNRNHGKGCICNECLVNQGYIVSPPNPMFKSDIPERHEESYAWRQQRIQKLMRFMDKAKAEIDRLLQLEAEKGLIFLKVKLDCQKAL